MLGRDAPPPFYWGFDADAKEVLINPEVLSAAAGVLLSLAFSYLPGLNGWFASLEGTHKRLVMLAALVLVAAGAFALSCAGAGARC